MTKLLLLLSFGVSGSYLILGCDANMLSIYAK